MHLDSHHQGSLLAHETTDLLIHQVVPDNDMILGFYWNHQDLKTWKFNSMWCDLTMV